MTHQYHSIRPVWTIWYLHLKQFHLNAVFNLQGIFVMIFYLWLFLKPNLTTNLLKLANRLWIIHIHLAPLMTGYEQFIHGELSG